MSRRFSTRCGGRRRTWVARALAVCFVVVAGCGPGDGPPLAPVTGTVTLDGAPLAGAHVRFSPEIGRASEGTTNSGGEYRLRYADQRDGAAVGFHYVEVRVRSTDASANSPSRSLEQVPATFNGQTMTAQVKTGVNVIHIELKSTPPPEKGQPDNE